MLENSGFDVGEIILRGGIFSFIGHQLSSVLILFYGVPLLNRVIYFLNKYFIVRFCAFLDKHIFKLERLTAGYTCIAVKK